MTSPSGFIDWLADQVDREDTTGAFAREATALIEALRPRETIPEFDAWGQQQHFLFFELAPAMSLGEHIEFAWAEYRQSLVDQNTRARNRP